MTGDKTTGRQFIKLFTRKAYATMNADKINDAKNFISFLLYNLAMKFFRTPSKYITGVSILVGLNSAASP